MLSPLTGAPVESETTRNAKSPTPVITQVAVKKTSFELLTLVPVTELAGSVIEGGTADVELGGVVLVPLVVVFPPKMT
jgi:hypothetical protein